MNNYFFTLLTIGAISVAAPYAQGSTNYWDNNGAAAGFGVADGTWGMDGKWSSDSTGGLAATVTNTIATDHLHFGTDIDGLGTGTITVSGTEQAFGTITFGGASGPITLANGTLNLASPASVIMVNNSSNTINSALAGIGGLTIQGEKLHELTYTSYLTTNPVVIFPNARLADYTAGNSILAGAWIPEGPANVYHFLNNGTTATYQLQAEDDGYIKCVKIELTQAGPDIAARAVYAKSLKPGTLGYNFDFGGNNSKIATSRYADGYGVAETKLVFLSTLTLTGHNTYSGNTTIDKGNLEIGGTGQLGDGSYSGDIMNMGVLRYNSAANQVFSGNISGMGRVVKESPYIAASSFFKYPLFLTETPTIILEKTKLSDCLGIESVLGGAYIKGPATSWFFTNNGEVATCQLQTTNDLTWTKCVKVELAQVGGDIAARVVYARYVDNGHILGYDFDNSPYTPANVATSALADGYGVAELTLNFKSHSTLTLSGSNRYTGGTVVNAGTLNITSAAALPSAGGINVYNGGELKLNVTGMDLQNSGVIGNGQPIAINQGGKLNLADKFNAGYNRPIIIDGGTLISTFYDVNGNDNGNYVNNLKLKNGGRVTGHKLRVGYLSAASITVSGTNACSITAGINMVKFNTDSLTFDVADVTDDAEADLLIPGVIRDFNDTTLANMPIIKRGAGTLELSAANTHVGMITIDAGAISLAAHNSLNAGNPIVLNGGALQTGAYTNNVGTLTVTADSTIVLGSGELAFTASSAATWSASLTITGELHPHSLRFGTDSSALTPAQLSAITLNNRRAVLSADGYLTGPPAGTVIIMR